MAEEIAYNVSVNTGGGAKSLKELKVEFKAAQNELSGLTSGTKEYIDALKKLGGIRDDIGDLNTEINAFNPEGKVQAFGGVISGMASGFQAATGAAALFGGESKEVEKALLKVQAVMAFSEGIKGVIGLGDAFTVLGNVIKAAFTTNPFGVIMIGITLLASALAGIYYSLDKTSEATKSLNAELEKQKGITEVLSKASQRQIELLTAQGKSEKEILEVKKKLTEQQIFELELSLKVHKSKIRDIQDNDSLMEGVWGLQKALYEKLGQTKAAEAMDMAIQGNKRERAKEDLDAIAKEGEDLLDLQNKIKVLSAEKIVINKKEYTEHKAILDKKAADDLAAYNKSAELINAEADAYDKKKAQKKQDLIDGQDAWKAAEEEQRVIEYNNAKQKEKDDKDKHDKKIALNKAEFDSTMATAQATNDSMANLSNFLFDLKRSHLVKGSAEELKAAKKQFQINKALAVSSNIISTIVGITNALGATSVIPEPFGTILKVANAAAIGISGTIATAKIASQKFNETGSSSGGGGGGSVGSVTMPSPPTISAPDQGNTHLNPNGSVNTSSTQQSTVKAIVVETDITKTQKRVSTIETRSKL